MNAPPLASLAWERFRRRGYPALISHGAGNSAAEVGHSLDAGADFVEIDIWFRKGRFEARHERRLGMVPLLFEKWYLAFARARGHSLTNLVAALAGETGVFLDIKSSAEATPGELARIFAEAPAGLPVAASSQQWQALRDLHDVMPSVPLFYSIDVVAQLDLFLSVMRRDWRPSGVSCRWSLLSPSIVDRLHGRGLLVVAWTVDDPKEAATLAEWGVDGITTHRVGEFRSLLAPS